MTASKKPELTSDKILAAITEHKPDSLSKLAHALGYRGSVSSWLKKRLHDLLPDLADRIKANKGAAATASEPATATVTASKPPRSSRTKPAAKGGVRTKCTRAESNPFREGSAYAATFDLLAATPEGIERSKLVAEVARITGKSQKKCYYDVTVVASSRKDGTSHKCISKAADIYYVDRTDGGWLKLVLRDRKF